MRRGAAAGGTFYSAKKWGGNCLPCPPFTDAPDRVISLLEIWIYTKWEMVVDSNKHWAQFVVIFGQETLRNFCKNQKRTNHLLHNSFRRPNSSKTKQMFLRIDLTDFEV